MLTDKQIENGKKMSEFEQPINKCTEHAQMVWFSGDCCPVCELIKIKDDLVLKIEELRHGQKF